MTDWLLWIVIAFACGSIPFGFIIGKLKGLDLRTVGSGNIGASNLGRAFGRRFFFLCFALDMGKGLIPTLIAGHLHELLGEFTVPDADAWWWLAVMGATVLGHMFTPWLGFKGGKGVATALGAMLGVFPALTVPAFGSLVVYLMVLALWRYISASSVAAAIALPIWTWFAHAQFQTLQQRRASSQPGLNETSAMDLDQMIPYSGWPFVIVAALLAVLVVYKHRGNLGRLAQGTEPKIGVTLSDGPDTPEDSRTGDGAGGPTPES